MNPIGNIPATATGTKTAIATKGGTAIKAAAATKGSMFGFTMGVGVFGVGVVLVTLAVIGYNYWEKKRELEKMGEDPTEILNEGELYPVE
ncbi:MAG: hypothetical protein HQL69_06470 [Magnetococcales bacterium]|nr:hypothetical protein [Magnetococcales bacterium]